MQTLRELLEQYRNVHGIKSEAALARRIGLTPSGLHRLTTVNHATRRRPSVQTVRQIADATGIDERTIVASVTNN